MTPEERAAEVVDVGNELGVSGDGDRHLKAAIATAIRAAEARERERCAKVAEDKAVFHRDSCTEKCKCADGWHIAAAIRATGTNAGHRNAMASASAHFAGEPVPPGVPTVADALALGSAVLRDIATGTNAAGGDRE